MYSLHELLCTDARVLNRHAGKMYGFLPGIVTAVHDPKEKRHQRGMVRVYFPGLQDLGGPDATIMPWARMVVANAGGMITPKKTKKEKRKIKVFTRTPKKVPWEVEVEVEETKFKEVDEKVRKEKQHPKKHWRVTKFDVDKYEITPETKKTLDEVDKFMDQEPKGKKILLHGHTSTTAPGGYNMTLSQNRVMAIRNSLVKRGIPPNFIETQFFGETHAGEKWDAEKKAWVTDDDGGHPNPGKCKATRGLPGGAGHECAGCRRVDIIIDYSECEVEYETKKKKVAYVEKTKKKINGERTVFEVKVEEKEVEVEVPEPGKPSGTGFYSPPQIGDEVLCAFEHGDMHHPYVIGSLWNGKTKLPAPSTPFDTKRDKQGPQTPDQAAEGLTGQGGKNNMYYFKSRTGNLVSLDDKAGEVRMQDRTGASTCRLTKDTIEITQSNGKVNISAKGTFRIDAARDVIVDAKESIYKHCADYKSKSSAKHIVEAKENWSVQAKGDATFKSTVAIGIQAAKMVVFKATDRKSVV